MSRVFIYCEVDIARVDANWRSVLGHFLDDASLTTSADGRSATQKQAHFLFGLAHRVRGYASEQTRRWIQSERRKNVEGLSKQEVSRLINELQKEGGDNGRE